MGLDSMGFEIYDIHGYFRRLTVGQRTPGFWGVTTSLSLALPLDVLVSMAHETSYACGIPHTRARV